MAESNSGGGKRTGLAPLPAGLLRPTTTPAPAEEPAPTAPDLEPEALDPADDAPRAAGRGGAPAAGRPRRKRTPVSTATRGRKLYLPDEIHDRLRLLAFSRREKVSTVAAEILDRSLPRFRVEREG